MEKFTAKSENILSYYILKTQDDKHFAINATWDALPSANDMEEGLAVITAMVRKTLGPGVTLEYSDPVKGTKANLHEQTKAQQRYLETGKHGLKTKPLAL